MHADSRQVLVVGPLLAQPLSSKAFQPFGQAMLIQADQGREINAGTSMRFDALAELDLERDGGRPCLAVFRSEGVGGDGVYSLSMLERHCLGTQSFVPLGATRIAVVVAPSLPDGRPNEAAMQAFIVEPGQGVTIRIGVWHHPLIVLRAGDVLVLERKGDAVDCELHPLRSQLMLVCRA